MNYVVRKELLKMSQMNTDITRDINDLSEVIRLQQEIIRQHQEQIYALGATQYVMLSLLCNYESNFKEYATNALNRVAVHLDQDQNNYYQEHIYQLLQIAQHTSKTSQEEIPHWLRGVINGGKSAKDDEFRL